MVESSTSAQFIVPGSVQGVLLLSQQPLSLWGGIDPKTGQIIDQRHDKAGECAAGRILAIPSEKGSSTGSAVLLELIRIGKAPAAIITCHLAPILALGSIIAKELYDVSLPILLVSEDSFAGLRDGEPVQIETNGTISSLEQSN
jgi:predicted aconitase with swiveling domain